MQYLKLNDYLREARGILGKRLPFLRDDEDSVSYVAYHGMMADKRFDVKKSDDRKKYRYCNYLFAVKKLVGNWKKNKKFHEECIENNLYDLATDNLSISQNPETIFLKKETINDIFNRTDILSERDLRILKEYMINGANLGEIGEMENISNQRVYFLLNRTINRLRAYYGTR